MNDVYVLQNAETGAVLAVTTRWERASMESANYKEQTIITNHDLLEEGD